eukprot:Skav200300  [mRNA]  locus=scaffold4329:63051:67384:+ [translate_table: standard]
MRLVGKQPNPYSTPEENHQFPTADTLTWKCRLCNVVVEGKSRREITWKRGNHFRLRHPHHQKTNADKFMKFTPEPVIATSELPMEQREWNCPWCNKGLPAIPSRWTKSLSVKHHYETEHHDIDTSATANHKQRAKNEGGNPNEFSRQHQGNRKRSETYKRIHASRRDFQKNGHNLVPFEPHRPTWDLLSIDRGLKLMPVFTCTKCKRFGKYLFANEKCKVPRTCIFHQLDDQNKQILANLWQISLEEANQIWVKASDKISILNFALAKVKRQKLVEEGIEPHPGPQSNRRNRAADIDIVSLNVQGCAGAWRALNTLAHQQILMLQETPWTRGDIAAFQQAANKKHYNVYYHSGRPAGNHRTGGVTTLVPKQFCQQPLQCPEEGYPNTYIAAVYVHQMALINCYAPPGEHATMAERLFDLVNSNNLDSYAWIMAGDWNEEPEEASHSHAIITQLGGTSLPTHQNTRWEGSKELDWFATSRPSWCNHSQINNELAISDHKAVLLRISTPQAAPQRYRYRPQPRWNKPAFLSDDIWREMLQHTWSQTTKHQDWKHLLQLASTINVDEEWYNYMELLSHTYRQATQLASQQANNEQQQAALRKTLKQTGHRNGKGTQLPSLQPFNNTIHVAGNQFAGAADRKLAKQLARRHEFRRLAHKAIQQHNAHYLYETSDQLRSLAEKVWPQHSNRDTTLGFLLRHGEVEVKQLQADRRRFENEKQKQRLDQWKHKMQSANTKTIGRWLQHKENPHIRVNITHGNQATGCGGKSPLQPPDLKTLAGAILDANGAAGCDSWSSTETKFLPFEAIQHFHQLTLRWHAAKQVPAVFSYSRQANLPKTQKIEQGCLKASHTRPITVFSIFYRAWASAWTRTEQFKAFAEALPAEIAGVYNHDGSEAAASFLQQQLVITKGVCVSLDYSQCYDRLRIPLTTQFLEKIGWPHEVIAILQQVWPTQRHIEFDKHVHPHTLAGSGVPQGCPFAPMALACVMTSGHNSVNEILQSDFGYSQEDTQQSNTKIYMDDRSFVDQNYQRCLDRAAAWHQWSHAVGLLENTEKAQALGKTKALHQKLVSDRPQWVQEKTMKVLGCSLRSQPAKNTTEEDQRITTAINRSKLLGCLPVSFKQKLELYKVFVLPKAMYGWISRFPTKTTANTLINNLTRISGGQHLANPVIRSVVYGGSTHAHPVTAVRMLQRFGRMRQANTIIWSNQPGTPTHALRKWLQEFEWEEIAPWQWKHGDQPMSLQAGTDCSLPAHQVRHAWRHVLLKQWSRGPRHEAALFQRRTSPLQMRTELQDIDLEATRRALEVTSANGRAIMLGSVVSPAMLSKMMPGKSPACPWCACPMATFEHLAWQCRGFPGMATRPEKPSNFLSWRFAWPTLTMSRSHHKRLLSWLAAIQEQLLLLRYNSG